MKTIQHHSNQMRLNECDDGIFKHNVTLAIQWDPFEFECFEGILQKFRKFMIFRLKEQQVCFLL